MHVLVLIASCPGTKWAFACINIVSAFHSWVHTSLTLAGRTTVKSAVKMTPIASWNSWEHTEHAHHESNVNMVIQASHPSINVRKSSRTDRNKKGKRCDDRRHQNCCNIRCGKKRIHQNYFSMQQQARPTKWRTGHKVQHSVARVTLDAHVNLGAHITRIKASRHQGFCTHMRWKI